MRLSILREPVLVTGSDSASSSWMNLSGAEDLHKGLLMAYLPVSARERARGGEHKETVNMKREDDRSSL